jgi:putative restriction endonuclease
MTREQRGKQLWTLLAHAATHRQMLTYRIVASLTGLHRPGIGDCLRPVQQYCTEQRLPPLTCLVVSEADGLPGPGCLTSPAELPTALLRVFDHDWLDTPSPTEEQLADAYSRAPDARGGWRHQQGRAEA